MPDGALLVVDGLIASVAASVLVGESERLHTVVLLHMPRGSADSPGERAVLGAAAAVVATSEWTRQWLLDEYGLDPASVHVAVPGTHPAELAPGSDEGAALLCVAAVIPHKGQDVLLAALSSLRDLQWRCVCAGPLDRSPMFVADLRRSAQAAGIADRVTFIGTLAGAELDRAYAQADVLVHPARAEAFGMVVTEALARGLPVIASDVGGIPEALGCSPDGQHPGRLVAAGDPVALATTLREWLSEAGARDVLREAARGRRATLAGWNGTADRIAVVAGLRPPPAQGPLPR